jgi:hypothetical protein
VTPSTTAPPIAHAPENSSVAPPTTTTPTVEIDTVGMWKFE